MISQTVCQNAAVYREQFQTAKPFKHVCIDGFFETGAAEQTLRDFPSFDAAKATNEHGQTGGKAVHSQLHHISAFYTQLNEYIASPEFLSAVSQLIGIPDLLPDPNLFGGGTHENLHGQELDPHVDFNYDESCGMHRRANLLLYLNKEWEEAWGGGIELHSNPRNAQDNQVKAFNPIFNRAVIFETNEYSWHGFPKIELPDSKRHLSRKCLSIYLYTKERATEEIVPPHGTFYVQRPLPDVFKEGKVLTADDVTSIKALLTRRDGWLAHYQRQELEHSRSHLAMKARIEQVEKTYRVPMMGYALQHGQVVGAFTDGWVGGKLQLHLRPSRPITAITVRGWAPKASRGCVLTGAVNKQERGHSVLQAEEHFELRLPVEQVDDICLLEVEASQTFKPSQSGGDERELCFLLSEVRVEH